MSWKDSAPVANEIWATAARLGVREFISRPALEEIRDDHLSLHEKGKIPSCDLIDISFMEKQWHTQADTPEHCSRSVWPRSVGCCRSGCGSNNERSFKLPLKLRSCDCSGCHVGGTDRASRPRLERAEERGTRRAGAELSPPAVPPPRADRSP